MSNKLAAAVRGNVRQSLMDAYTAYKERKPGSLDNLFKVIRSFVYMKLYHLEYDFRAFGSAETVDDWTQDACLNIWKGLGKFKGVTPEAFYAWVHRAAFMQSQKSFNELKKESETKVSLVVKRRGGDNDEEHEVENPEIYSGYGQTEPFTVRIPRSVQGIELDICKLIMAGMNYERIGKELGMTANAVNKRLIKLRGRMDAERKAARPTTS